MTELKAELIDTHERLNLMLGELSECVRAEDRTRLGPLFDDFERELSAHLDWEEMYLIPEYAAREPENAKEILAEHQTFRSRLGELALAIDTHAIRAEFFDGFVEQLHAHAERENRLYADIDESRLASLLRRLRTRIRSPRNSYGFSRVLKNTTLVDAEKSLTATLKQEGFGVLTRIDVTETFRKKLDVEFRPYVILGACNPTLAHQALGIDSQIGLLLPCNVILEQTSDGVSIAAIDPRAMFRVTGDARLEPVAEQVADRLRRAIAAA